MCFFYVDQIAQRSPDKLMFTTEVSVTRAIQGMRLMTLMHDVSEWMVKIDLCVVWTSSHNALLFEGVCWSGMPYAGNKLQSMHVLVSRVIILINTSYSSYYLNDVMCDIISTWVLNPDRRCNNMSTRIQSRRKIY